MHVGKVSAKCWNLFSLHVALELLFRLLDRALFGVRFAFGLAVRQKSAPLVQMK